MKKEYMDKIKKLSLVWGLTIEKTKDKIISNLNWIQDDDLFNHILTNIKKENITNE